MWGWVGSWEKSCLELFWEWRKGLLIVVWGCGSRLAAGERMIVKSWVDRRRTGWFGWVGSKLGEQASRQAGANKELLSCRHNSLFEIDESKTAS